MSEFDFRDLLIKHWGKIAGAFGGLLFALAIITFGFWKGLFIIFCVIAGLIIGWAAQGNSPGLKDLLDRLFKGN